MLWYSNGTDKYAVSYALDYPSTVHQCCIDWWTIDIVPLMSKWTIGIPDGGGWVCERGNDNVWAGLVTCDACDML